MRSYDSFCIFIIKRQSSYGCVILSSRSLFSHNRGLSAFKHWSLRGIDAADDHVNDVLWFFLLVLLAEFLVFKMVLRPITQKFPKVPFVK